MSAIDELRKIYNPRDLAYTHTMQAVIESILDLAAQVSELRERVEKERNNRRKDIEDVLRVMIQLEDRIDSKLNALNNTKPAPTKDREPRTCRDCNRYDSGLCLKHNRRVSSEAHICNDFGPAKDREEVVIPRHIIVRLLNWKGTTCLDGGEEVDIAHLMPILREFAGEVRA